MRTLSRRRAINLAFLGGVCLLLTLGVQALTRNLYRTSLLTGWLLLALLVALAFFNARKKLPFVPMGRASTWLQFHLYAGVLAAVLFLFHIRGRVPRGVLEATLAAAFVLVIGSGVAGILLSRDLARRLTSRGQEVIFERIPTMRRRIRERAEGLALASVNQYGTTALADFYTRFLASYFEGPRNIWRHLLESKRPSLTWNDEFALLDRYLNEAERGCARELSDLVRLKEDLDYHTALQGALKVWLFVHIPLTYVMLILGVFHGLLAQAFASGSR